MAGDSASMQSFQWKTRRRRQSRTRHGWGRERRRRRLWVGFASDQIARRGSVFKVPNPSGSLITIWWGLCGLDFVDASFLGQSFGESSTEALFNLDRTHLIERPPESLGFGVLNSGPSRLYQERPHRFMPSLTRAPRHPYRLLLLSPPSSGHLSICCWNWKQIRSQIVCEVLDDIVSVVIDFPIGFKL